MRTLLLWCLFVVIGFNGFGQTTPVDTTKRIVTAEDWRVRPWKEYQSFEGKFKVYTPGDFLLAVDTVQTNLGKLAYHMHVYHNQQKFAENVFYMITWVDYPLGTIHQDSTELLDEFFKASMDEAAQNVRGKVAYSGETSLQGYPGYLWRINYKMETAVIKTRVFVRDNRYYSIQTVTVKDLAINAASDRFFDSFQFL